MGMEMDFSKFSKVQDSLKESLLARFEERQLLSDETLDEVVAAGNNFKHAYDTCANNASNDKKPPIS